MRIQIGYFRRARILIAAISIATFAASAAQAGKANVPMAASHILLVDTDSIWARYSNPKSSDEDKKARKAELIKSMQPTLKKLSDRNSGAIVLEKDLLFPGVEGGDITPWVIADLDSTYIPQDPSVPPPPLPHAVRAIAPRALLADRDQVDTILRKEGYHDPDASLLSATKMTEASFKVDVVIDYGKVILGVINMNISSDLAHFLRGGTTRLGGLRPTFPVQVLALNRGDILEQSKVGKSVTAQVESLTHAAEADFATRRADLDKDAAALQVKMASLDPEEQKQEIDAFDAKRDAFNADIEERRHELEAAVTTARKNIEKALDPILKSLMHIHHANLLVETGSVLYAPAGLDITADTIAELDLAMSSVPVQLPSATPPHAPAP